jgi:hypothetical protein
MYRNVYEWALYTEKILWYIYICALDGCNTNKTFSYYTSGYMLQCVRYQRWKWSFPINNWVTLYRVIKESLCAWWLQYTKLQVMFKVFPASLQTFIDSPNCVLEDRVQYSTVHIPNVFCNGHLQTINCVGIVPIRVVCIVIVRCTEPFWSHCKILHALCLAVWSSLQSNNFTSF